MREEVFCIDDFLVDNEMLDSIISRIIIESGDWCGADKWPVDNGNSA